MSTKNDVSAYHHRHKISAISIIRCVQTISKHWMYHPQRTHLLRCPKISNVSLPRPWSNWRVLWHFRWRYALRWKENRIPPFHSQVKYDSDAFHAETIQFMVIQMAENTSYVLAHMGRFRASKVRRSTKSYVTYFNLFILKLKWSPTALIFSLFNCFLCKYSIRRTLPLQRVGTICLIYASCCL